MKFTLAELATHLEIEVAGDADTVITGVAPIESAQAGDLCFLSDYKYAHYLETTQASAVILKEQYRAFFNGNALLSTNPYLSYAKASELFDKRPVAAAGVHERAVVADDVELATGVSVGANAVVESGASIGANTTIGAGCFIGARARIGDNCLLHANATIYHDCELGNEVIVHSQAVIGADGFGFATDEKGCAVKIFHVGAVVLHDQVEVGAGSTIDRGTHGNTVVETGVKIDNQVQIGHNCHIGAHSRLCGCVGIAGSTKIGQFCMLGGAVGVGGMGPVRICDHVHITVRSLVTQSIEQPGVYSSGTPLQASKDWKKNTVRFRQLDRLAKRLQRLERRHSTPE